MTRIGDQLEREWDHLRAHLPHYHHNHQPEEAPAMTLPIITAIEDEAHALGHEISDVLHQVLSKHLTVGNMLAHAGQFAARAEESPIVQALERFALGPAGEAAVAKVVEDVAVLLAAQATPAAVDGTPDAVPAQ
jgi:hypothetical protein